MYQEKIHTKSPFRCKRVIGDVIILVIFTMATKRIPELANDGKNDEKKRKQVRVWVDGW